MVQQTAQRRQRKILLLIHWYALISLISLKESALTLIKGNWTDCVASRGSFVCMVCEGGGVDDLWFLCGWQSRFLSMLSPCTHLQHRDPGPKSQLRWSLGHLQITFMGECAAYNYIWTKHTLFFLNKLIQYMYGLPELKGSASGDLKVLMCSAWRKEFIRGIYKTKTHSFLTTQKRQGMRNKGRTRSKATCWEELKFTRRTLVCQLFLDTKPSVLFLDQCP